ncbi:MAG: hypothetical protein WBB74_01660 [Gaiellaceae bacterium]
MVRDPFLNNLIGSWDMRGTMGETPLHQAVGARWVLRDRYVQMRFRELEGAPYEALYHVGRNDGTDLYVLHLLDSTGVYPEPNHVVGRGRREGNSISFAFGDVNEAFTNRLTWDAAAQTWEWKLTYVDEGEMHTFAKKRMVRA